MSGVHEIGGIGDWLEMHARWRPRREALVDRGERLDYGRLNSRVNRVAHALIARGVRKCDRVAAIMPNFTVFLETLFACARLGAIFVPINFRLSPAEVRFILEDAGVHVIVYHALGRVSDDVEIAVVASPVRGP